MNSIWHYLPSTYRISFNLSWGANVLVMDSLIFYCLTSSGFIKTYFFSQYRILNQLLFYNFLKKSLHCLLACIIFQEKLVIILTTVTLYYFEHLYLFFPVIAFNTTLKFSIILFLFLFWIFNHLVCWCEFLKGIIVWVLLRFWICMGLQFSSHFCKISNHYFFHIFWSLSSRVRAPVTSILNSLHCHTIIRLCSFFDIFFLTLILGSFFCNVFTFNNIFFWNVYNDVYLVYFSFQYYMFYY